MDVTPIQRTMLALAFFADLELAEPYVNDCEEAVKAYDAISAQLHVLKHKTGADWSIAWGPAVFSFPIPGDPAGRHFDNLMYVAKSGTDNYAVAIAGTNGKSVPDWIFEDALVRVKVPWLFAAAWKPVPQISFATFVGLSVLLQVAPPCAQVPGTGQKLLPYLASVAKDKPITVYTTGHSLGGALSPTLALALEDLRGQWDVNGTATVSPFSFAGATPGDGAFAAYFRSRFPNGMQRIWNERDIVPHAWDVAHLQEIPTLYNDRAPPDVQKIVDTLVARVQSEDYAPLDDTPAAFKGALLWPTPADDIVGFLKEAYHQHIHAYAKWGKMDQWFWPKPDG